MTRLQINGRHHDVDVPQDTPVLWILRDELGLTGTKFGCGMALCGACTVHLDGAPVRSCVMPAIAAVGHAIVTIEQLQEDRIGRVVQQTWLDLAVAQCGYCQAGQILSATALLRATPAPDDSQIDDGMAGNLCRCGTYPRIRAAIRLAARRLAGEAV